MSDPFAPPSRTPEPEKPGEQATEKIGYEPSSTYPAAAAPGTYPAAPAPGAYEPTPYGGTPGAAPGAVGTPYPGGPVEPSDSRGWVIAGFLTFWPLGIAALFPSLRAARAIGAGDLQTASTEAASAKKRGIIAIIICAVMVVLYVIAWIAIAGIIAANVQSAFDDVPSVSESSPSLEELTEGLVEDDPTAELPAEAVETSKDELTVGQCVLSTGMTGGTDTLHVVPCEVPHGAEIYAQVPFAQDTYPTEEEATIAEYELCGPAFDEFVGIAYLESQFEYWAQVPSEDAWAAGNHNITCVIESYEGDVVTGTLQGAAY